MISGTAALEKLGDSIVLLLFKCGLPQMYKFIYHFFRNRVKVQLFKLKFCMVLGHQFKDAYWPDE